MFLFVTTARSLHQLPFHERLFELVNISATHVLYQDERTVLISNLPSLRDECAVSVWISGNPDYIDNDLQQALNSKDWERFGSRFQFDEASGHWKLETDLTGVFAPTYLNLDDAFLVADDHRVFLKLRVPGLRENPNWMAEIIISGFPHDNTSILLPLEKIPANATMEGDFEKMGSISCLNMRSNFTEALTPDETFDLAKTELEVILSPFKDYSLGLQLTGGYDSRLILSSLLRLGISPRTFIYGIKDNYNSDIAQTLADSLNVNHTFIPLSMQFEKLFSELLLEAIMNTGGIASPSHTHIYYAAKQIPSDVKYLFSGIAGGELHRGINDEAPVIPKLLANIIRNGEEARVVGNSNSLVSQIIPELQMLVNERIETLTLKWKKECSEGLLPEIILRNAFGGFFRSVIFVENASLTTVYPFLDPRYLKVIFRSPYGLVHGRNMQANIIDKLKSQRNLVREFYPAPDPFFSLRTDKGFPPKYLFMPFIWPIIPFLVRRSRRFRANLGELDNVKWLKRAYSEFEDLLEQCLPEVNKKKMDGWINGSSSEDGKVAISRVLHIAAARYALKHFCEQSKFPLI